MNASRGAILAFGVLGLGFLAVGGITASKMSGVLGMGGVYDMPPAQVKSFVQSASTRQGWTASKAGIVSALRKRGEEQLDYTAPLLPWMNAHVTVRFWPEGSGTQLEISGNGEQVKALKAELDNRLPTLGAP